jgi:hypothetical protein
MIIIFIIGCIRQPDEPIDTVLIDESRGVYILCEGLYGQNNSSLSRFSYISSNIYNYFFESTNPGMKIGDTANDLLVIGDTTYIVVSSNKKIIAIETKTGKFINELRLNSGSFPRKIIRYNDSIAFISDLYRHAIIKINYKKMIVVDDNIPTGPAPEGMALNQNNLFVANSGYGDYLSHLPHAGTISVFDINSMNIIKRFENVPNVIELKVSIKNQKLYSRYNHLPKYKDSVGGIVEYDLNSMTETKRWIIDSYHLILSDSEDSLFILSDNGMEFINLKENSQSLLIIQNPNKSDIWQTAEINYFTQEIWIANSKNYQSSAELLIYDLNNPSILKKQFKLGLNPNTIVFF